MQTSTSRAFDSRQAGARRVARSMIATRERNPRRIGIQPMSARPVPVRPVDRHAPEQASHRLKPDGERKTLRAGRGPEVRGRRETARSPTFAISRRTRLRPTQCP